MAPELLRHSLDQGLFAPTPRFLHAGSVMIYPATGLGLAIPALVYALTRVAAVPWIERGLPYSI